MGLRLLPSYPRARNVKFLLFESILLVPQSSWFFPIKICVVFSTPTPLLPTVSASPPLTPPKKASQIGSNRHPSLPYFGRSLAKIDKLLEFLFAGSVQARQPEDMKPKSPLLKLTINIINNRLNSKSLQLSIKYRTNESIHNVSVYFLGSPFQIMNRNWGSKLLGGDRRVRLGCGVRGWGLDIPIVRY